ncbi:MAG: metal-sensing transcriptional repressor [Chloroflexota bacterium]
MSLEASRDRGAAIRHAQRVGGQVAALASMIDRAEPFPNLAQQILAARGSLDSLLVRLVELELRDCVPSREARDEVDGLLRTALGRSAFTRSGIRTRHPRGGAASCDPIEERTTR